MNSQEKRKPVNYYTQVLIWFSRTKTHVMTQHVRTSLEYRPTAHGIVLPVACTERLNMPGKTSAASSKLLQATMGLKWTLNRRRRGATTCSPINRCSVVYIQTVRHAVLNIKDLATIQSVTAACTSTALQLAASYTSIK